MVIAAQKAGVNYLPRIREYFSSANIHLLDVAGVSSRGSSMKVLSSAASHLRPQHTRQNKYFPQNILVILGRDRSLYQMMMQVAVDWKFPKHKHFQ